MNILIVTKYGFTKAILEIVQGLGHTAACFQSQKGDDEFYLLGNFGSSFSKLSEKIRPADFQLSLISINRHSKPCLERQKTEEDGAPGAATALWLAKYNVPSFVLVKGENALRHQDSSHPIFLGRVELKFTAKYETGSTLNRDDLEKQLLKALDYAANYKPTPQVLTAQQLYETSMAGVCQAQEAAVSNLELALAEARTKLKDARQQVRDYELLIPQLESQLKNAQENLAKLRTTADHREEATVDE